MIDYDKEVEFHEREAKSMTEEALEASLAKWEKRMKNYASRAEWKYSQLRAIICENELNNRYN